MKYPVRFFAILLVTFYTNISKSENLIVYINMDRVMNETLAGKYINEQLEKIHEINLYEFKKIEEDLKKEETQILSQKNILSKDEYAKKVNSFKSKVNIYKRKRQEKINLVTKQKAEASKKLIMKINPILSDFSIENSISIILPKKNVVLAKTELDITNKIIDIANSKIKKITLN